MAVDRDAWMKFYPSDWRGDEGLALCSYAARGLWVEMMCLAHKEGGYILLNGCQPSVKELARGTRGTPAEVTRLIAELARNKVLSITPEGTMFSRRIVRDAKRRETNQANGRHGGHPAITPKSVKPSVNRNDAERLTESVNTQKLEARSQNPENQIKSVSPEPLRVSVPAVLTFGTVGKAPEWGLSQPQIAEWSALYPGLDVLTECRKAAAWIGANPHRRKTSSGMLKFLVGWLNRSSDSARPSAPMRQPFHIAGPTRSEAWEVECGRLHGFDCAGPQEHAARMAQKAEAS